MPTTSTPSPSSAPLRRVRLWLGDGEEYLIAEYHAPVELAVRYAATMTPQFAGIRITSDRYDTVDQVGTAALPADPRLWPITAL
ncbi:hypothetical protein ACFWUU_40400 [Kribbella sp. NPDC058693]|uniref:hypothetical protein n=1 Tax=Kribbella sp. NPDC058693 TaxID=3346602 RepID=UPI00365747CE